MTKNILDQNGNIIGSMTLPDNTPDDVWTKALSAYSASPTVQTIQQRVQASIQAAMQFGQSMIIQAAAGNVLNGITQSGKTAAVALYLGNLIMFLNTGSLYAAIGQINIYIADTSDAKAACAPFVNNSNLIQFKNQIETWLGIPLTS